MKTQLRIGAVGAGTIAQLAHLPAAQLSEDVEIAALCDRRPHLLRLVAERFHIARTHETAEALFADESIEAVDLCVPTIAHDELAVMAMEAGKHVLCEKPMASNVVRARRMIAAAEQSGVRLMIGHHKRYDPGCEQAREVIRNGRIGQPRLVVYQFGTGNWTAPAPRGPLTSSEPAPPWGYEYPPGIDDPRHRAYYESALEMLTHITNLIRWLAGDPQWVLGAQHAANAVRGTLMLGWGEDGSDTQAFCVDGPHYAANVWNETLTVWGDEGGVTVTLPQNVYVNKPARVRVFDAGAGAETLLREEYGWAFRNELEDFAHCVRTGERFRTAGEDSIKDLVIAEAATAAAAGLVELPAPINYEAAGPLP